MDSKSCISLGLRLILSLILALCFSSHATAQTPPSSTPTTPATICNNTPHPSFCKLILQKNQSATVYDFDRYFVRHSSSITDRFVALLDGYLRYKSTFSESTIRALHDCRDLALTTKIFLKQIIQNIASTNTLQSSNADQVQTLLSATLTNLQTCIDGLHETASAEGPTGALLGPLKNGTMAYSVALALFVKGWGPHSSKGKWVKEKHVDKIWVDPPKGRKLLQAGRGGVKVVREVFVNRKGGGNFTNITAAVAAAPNNTVAGSGYFVIHVAAGVYEEYVNIASNKKYIMMIGEGPKKTIITGNRSVVDGWTTFNSASFVVTGEGFVAINMTFRNTAGAIKHQAVAVRNGADLSTFYLCNFEGYQDTLYTHSLRQFYRECNISGTVDFIFGNAAVVLQKCVISARLPLRGQFNALTAQGRTDINQNTGTIIQNCTIKGSTELKSSNYSVKTYLGRPWKEYSRTVYMMSQMDSLIDPAGWKEWNGTFALDTLYYGEYKNTGSGSKTKNRVTWPGYHIINETSVASNFTVSNFTQGDVWLLPTGVTFTGGLLA